ncbi:TPA: hypothetical protein ACX6Q7_001299 [Photobacterium damselae]
MITSTSGSGTVLASWIPVGNLLPSYSWSPGFIFGSQDINLIGPGSNSVNIRDAIKIIGVEYKANSKLSVLSGENLPGGGCYDSGFSGDIAYVKSSSPTVCRSKDVFNSNNKMPFHFLRPIVDLDDHAIINAFDSLKNKDEGFYNAQIQLKISYAYEQINGIKTWRNLSYPINVSIYYKPGFITDIRLENPGVHEMSIKQSSSPDRIKGEAIFHVIAEGFFNNGIGLKMFSGNKYELTNTGRTFSIPYSIECPRCNNMILVKDGVVKSNEAKILGSLNKKIRFPIVVSFEEDKLKLPLGNYNGQFTILFTADL